MPFVRVGGSGSFENALRKFKKQCEREGILSEIKIGDTTAVIIAQATIDADDEPNSDQRDLTVVKVGSCEHVFNHLANIMITGHTINRQAKRQHGFTKAIIGLTAVILNQVAGHRHEAGVPPGCLNMTEDVLKGGMGYRASQTRMRISEQVWVCDMQDPKWICRRLNSATSLCWRGFPQSPGRG